MSNDNNGAAMAVRDETQRGLTTADPEHAAGALAHILATGDLSKLTNEQRVATYLQQCSTLGVAPISRPFDWLVLDGKLVLYPNKSCAEQLRRLHQISIKITRAEVVGGDTKEPMYVVTVEGRRPNGQTDESTKYVPLSDSRGRLTGKNLANAYAKAESGAKRRLTFSMIGMAAPPDELENARVVIVDGTGRVIDNPSQEQKAIAADPNLARVLREPTYETTAQAADAPLSGHASQAPTIDELTPPARTGAKVSLRCDADKWRAAYFGATADTDMETAEGRRAFLASYTAAYTPALRTDSLSDFLKRATDSQAEQMVTAARAAADDLRRGSVSAASDESQETEPDSDEEDLADLAAQRAAEKIEAERAELAF